MVLDKCQLVEGWGVELKQSLPLAKLWRTTVTKLGSLSPRPTWQCPPVWSSEQSVILVDGAP